MSDAKQILVLNAGSSSLKLGLFDWDTQRELDEKNVSWGKDTAGGVTNHTAALSHLLEQIKLGEVAAVGHRVVHGGANYSQAVLIDDSVKNIIQEMGQIAPLHNPVALEVIEAAQKMWPTIPQVAAFDTAFHTTLAPEQFLYAVPYEWYEKWGVRRFGFHGLSHQYCANRAAEMLQRPLTELKIVNCHLGNGCSLAAIAGGKSVATTMGFTPLEGLMMGTRAGSVDPGLLLFLLEHHYIESKALDDSLNHDSGLKGISGASSDMREIQKAMAQGDKRAELAFNMFAARVREHIGAMVAVLDGVDAIVFAGGIGENSAQLRATVCQNLGWLGLQIDLSVNNISKPDVNLTAPHSQVQTLVIHTREELVVARQTHQLVSNH